MTRLAALGGDPSAMVAALKARPGSPLAAGLATGFDTVAGGLKPRFAAAAAASESKTARLTLPASAAAAFHLEDAATSVSLDVSLKGATAVVAQAADGDVIYANALGQSGTIVHRPLPSGTEDFFALEAKPAATQIAYDVGLGAGAAGLRLVGGTLEVLDSAGAPRLRVAPPFIVGADGVTTGATIAVAGCAVDTNPAPPWGRAVIMPGAATCQVKVTWPGSGVACGARQLMSV